MYYSKGLSGFFLNVLFSTFTSMSLIYENIYSQVIIYLGSRVVGHTSIILDIWYCKYFAISIAEYK